MTSPSTGRFNRDRHSGSLLIYVGRRGISGVSHGFPDGYAHVQSAASGAWSSKRASCSKDNPLLQMNIEAHAGTTIGGSSLILMRTLLNFHVDWDECTLLKPFERSFLRVSFRVMSPSMRAVEMFHGT